MMNDIRLAIRALGARPGFTAVALLTIALGLGANTAIFGVINTVYFRPLPFDAENRLVRVQEYSQAPDGSRRRVGAAGATFELVRDHVTAFDAVVAQTGGSFTLDAGTGAERVSATFVSDGWGRLLGVPPVSGRHFTAQEEQAGQSARVVLIGHGLWQRHFGGRPDAVGATLRLSGADYEVVGVMPTGFRYPYDAELWMPARFAPDQSLYVLARLAPGATVDQANAELAGIAERLAEVVPARRGMGVDAHSARTNIQQGEDRLAVALMGAVGFLLLIACANVAMLLTTRFATRQHEVAVRAALGCGRARQIRLFVIETMVLFSAGAMLGVVLTLWLKDSLTALVPRVLATQLAMGEVVIDARVFGFVVLLALGTGTVFGLIAAARASTGDLQSLIKQGGRGTTAGGQRTLSALVVAEVALAVILLSGAGQMISAFERAQRLDLGFRPQGLLTFRLDLSRGRYTEAAPRIDVLERLRARLKTLPGVEEAGTISVNPLCCGDWGARVVVAGEVPPSPEATPVVFHRYVTPGALEAMGVRLIEGRLLAPSDAAGSQPVVLVDEPFARRFFPNQSAIGQRVKRAPYDSPQPWLTIVGVVADVSEEGDYHEGWYLPYAQDPLGASAQHAHVMVRADGDPLALIGSVRQALAGIDAGLPPFDFRTMDTVRAEQLQQERMGTVLVVLFAAFGLLLSIVGVYGLTSFVVTQRTREMGVRLVLGAAPGQLISAVLTRAAWLAAAGVVVGAVAAFAVARVLQAVIPDTLVDPLVVAAAAAIAALVTLAAAAVPAVRATRLDAAAVLRAAE